MHLGVVEKELKLLAIAGPDLAAPLGVEALELPHALDERRVFQGLL